MTNLEPILSHVTPFLMVLFRLSGLLLFAPALSSPLIPARVRALLVGMFALALYPTIPVSQQVPIDLDWMSLGIAVVGETLIGLVIGLLAALPMYAVQLGGLVMGQQMGLGLANVYNPALDIEGDVVGQFLLYLALAIFLQIGGLDAAFLAVAKTFANVPIGAILLAPLPVVPDPSLLGTTADIAAAGQVAAPSAFSSISFSALDLLSGVIASGFELALRISAPVLCIILLETIATAFIMKTMPQLNIMSIGFATKVVLALLGLVLAFRAIAHVTHDDVEQSMSRMVEWAESLRVEH